MTVLSKTVANTKKKLPGFSLEFNIILHHIMVFNPIAFSTEKDFKGDLFLSVIIMLISDALQRKADIILIFIIFYQFFFS